jgi:hypothetical protein
VVFYEEYCLLGCDAVKFHRISPRASAFYLLGFLLDFEEEGELFFRNVNEHLQNYTAAYRR